ncbi:MULTISPECIES: AAA family ATPase [Acinetobacter calcoaceticus/baumannii complex]|uniref:AAA family ATPase n=1 Tax=Acinetobacter calcoaceticus/baumannii complex TaxID=909768 RepID=UPI0025AF92AE|nr:MULTISPECIES: AAA family ATPase [Acinetobacter calcoaceticus/baumannii complex]MDQ9035760.1 AAA family ATPase [Acinetobacter seifertii]
MIREEYLRFLQTFNVDTTSINAKKIANIILDNLEELTQLSTHQGQRIRRIIALAQPQWNGFRTEITVTGLTNSDNHQRIKHLKHIVVGPFRGFARAEEFHLDSQCVLIYGSNGTGKSSFCEALEYSLLGSVSEAETKRFRDQSEYLKNAHVNQFAPPHIIATDSNGAEVIVEPNASKYRFCFVEKNRIDNFSRIAAQAPSKQTELISTLFGLEEFTDFVRNFTTEIDERYIDIQGEKTKLLAQKRLELSSAQQIKINNTAELETISHEEIALAQRYKINYSFSLMVKEIIGTEDSLGAIPQLEQELQTPIPFKSNLTTSALDILINNIGVNINQLNIQQQELGVYSQQVSFKKLYEAVIQIQPSNPESCPACHTPLNQVTINPYQNSQDELKKLQHLAEIQKRIQDIQQIIGQYLFSLAQMVSTCLHFLPTSNPLAVYKISNGIQPSLTWWNSLLQPLVDGFTPYQHIQAQVKQLENTDLLTDQVQVTRNAKQAELHKLREFEHQITVLQTRRGTADNEISKTELLITNFNTQNAQLINEVMLEGSLLQRNQSITAGYAEFVSKINEYNRLLPSQLVADLGETVTTLYNAFNRYDSPHEKLGIVQLPLMQSQKLLISFQTEPTKFFDALHILSEGHIRCIGLAILLAKNIKENCPILIFDDPVNAIDDEHRGAIRETLFKDSFFEQTQIILAIHGEEFFNNTHQILGKQRAAISESYIFSPNKPDKHIYVQSLQRPKNYVLVARELFSRGEYRDALMSSRRALENLCDKTWVHYGKHCDQSDKLISVSRRSPNQPWDLRSLAENLKTKINASRGNIPNKTEIISALTTLLGPSGNHPCWCYLNKGTHGENDLPEFDHNIVGIIVASLEQLDSAIS